ncbi:phage virion morphogenesis protein [Sphingomonas sp. Mn802worker]|uniref:phage virion morphogenesis protein n=1 Tax=Sphingomonas sp. Mn802worker TaxID=629773 RepID=UPI0003673CEC|nr:phage virion morphogenesis protein [Sphingomonas sp. Mn802worker]
MNDFAPIEQLCRDLLLRVGAAERSKLMRAIGREIRKSQSDRIGRQQQPDGSSFAPHRPKKPRAGEGRLRQQKMFRKIRMAKSLRNGGNGDEVWIGFGGRAARIAAIHQLGLSDAPARGQPKVRYTRRVLLGLTDAEREHVLDLIIEHVAGA